MAEFLACHRLIEICECYSDNNGAYIDAVVWNVETETVESVGGMYDSLEPGQWRNVPAATADQVEKAGQQWIDECLDVAKRVDCNNARTYIGCHVILKRSRKAPNGVSLLVLDYDVGGYNARYMQRDPARVKIAIPEGGSVWVNYSCIDRVVKGKPAYWASSERIERMKAEEAAAAAVDSPVANGENGPTETQTEESSMVDCEFIVEEIDEHGDIINVTHHDTYAAAAGERDDLLKTSAAHDYHVALVRDAGENREWCYISKLGHNVGFVDAFSQSTGRNLPAKFAKQVADYHN